ncbi:hypothetical protein Cni_G27929 [Canna indica]|uniref:Uncharacterized protein n=1 Tax=Canna indica TaxID=4628 RepID=A0AAQ3L4R1_9LILI|nr:hypothetical protein Cni_G27929 [Canna indica]
MSRQCSWRIYIFSLIVLLAVVSAKSDGNPTNDIVDFINANRTGSKLPKLSNSPGLGCMALQLLLQCTKNCSNNNTLDCHPPEVDITEVYAPNCGVELPTVDTISGRLLGCFWKPLDPEQALSAVLVPNKKSLSLVQSKEHSEVGVGYVGVHHGPFLWGVLFSSGNTSSSFVLEGGKGIEQRSGCFSGINVPCNVGNKLLLTEKILMFSISCLILQVVLLV